MKTATTDQAERARGEAAAQVVLAELRADGALADRLVLEARRQRPGVERTDQVRQLRVVKPLSPPR
jgi:hypothetical protein